MTYQLIVNQPFQSTYNVLSCAIHFLLCMDPGLKRLEDKWRALPGGIGLYDSFNRTRVLVGVLLEEAEGVNDYCHFYVDDEWYKPHPDLSRGQLNDVIDVINDYYGDIFCIDKTPIGYGYYRAIKTARDKD